VKNSNLKLSAAVAALALLVPAGAVAKRPDDKPANGKAPEARGPEARGPEADAPKADRPKAKPPKVKVVTANVKGLVTANDGATLTVMVAKASGQAKACKGQALTFDVSKARFHTADNDADGDMDAADVLVGHAVKVQGKVALSKGRKTTCGVTEGQVVPARQVHDKTTPEPDEGEEEETPEA
jgi:hypothetical protein